MRRYLICSMMLLASCGPGERTVYVPQGVDIPADLLAAVPGWTGPAPRDEGEWVDAAAAEKRGREQANAQLSSIAEIVAPPASSGPR